MNTVREHLQAHNPVPQPLAYSIEEQDAILAGILEAHREDDGLDLTADTLPKRRRPAVRLAAAAAAVGMLCGGYLTITSQHNAAYSVTRHETGVVTVDLNRILTSDDIDDLIDSLRDEGVPITIRPEPTSPGRVGEVGGLEGPAVETDGATIPGFTASADGSKWMIDTRVVQQPITIGVGVEAGADEDYFSPSSPFAKGERLAGMHCGMSRPIPTSELEQRLSEQGVSVTRWVIQGTPTPTGDGDYAVTQTEVATRPDGFVNQVWLVREGQVQVDTVSAAALRSKHARLLHPMSYKDCTEALAAQWRQ